MRSYFFNLMPKTRILLAVPVLALAYCVATIVVPEVIRVIVPDVVRSVFSLM